MKIHVERVIERISVAAPRAATHMCGHAHVRAHMRDHAHVQRTDEQTLLLFSFISITNSLIYTQVRTNSEPTRTATHNTGVCADNVLQTVVFLLRIEV